MRLAGSDHRAHVEFLSGKLVADFRALHGREGLAHVIAISDPHRIRVARRGGDFACGRIVVLRRAHNAGRVFRILVRGEMELLADVPAKYMLKLASNQSARVEVIGAGEFPGRVRTISPQTDPTTQLGQAYIFVGRDQKLHVGAFARAVIDGERSCGPTVPISAVLYASDGAVVQVVRDNRIETRRVRVGLLSNQNAEIREGLVENDLVVSRAGAFLREGDPVKPLLAQAAK